MQAFFKRTSVILAFVILLVILLANAVATRRQLEQQLGNQRWVAHTRQVLFELSQTESLLKDEETSQRGFLYTGDPKYLGPYKDTGPTLDAAIQDLADLTADNPAQRARVAQLRNLVRDKLSELAQTIELYQAGKTGQAQELVRSDKGLVIMDKIRHLIDEMSAEELRLEATREASYRKSISNTFASIYLTTLLATCGLILLAWFILREMNLREKHAAHIRAREEWFRVTLSSIGDGIIATDALGRVEYINPIAEQLTGRELKEVHGRNIVEVFPIFNEYTHQPTENPVEKVMQLGRIIGLANHTVLQHVDGTLTPIEDSAAPIRDDQNRLIGVVLVFRDATHERRSHEILRKTEKLAAAARLSATMAHEINNPLESVGNLIYLAKQAGISEEAAGYLASAEHELDRVSHITRQTLGFYRESSTPVPVDFSMLVDSVLKLYTNKFSTKSINVIREFEPCPEVQGLQGELKQLISNLISNAADAVGNHGQIEVRLRNVVTANGPAVRLSIKDNGSGIAKENLDRIFEPFFTTKKDVGTGLGLWVTKEIVSRHNGTIQVASQSHSQAGTTFTVEIPCNSEATFQTAQD